MLQVIAADAEPRRAWETRMTIPGAANILSDLERIRAKIKSLADGYMASGRPYLLSKLGLDLGSDLQTLKLLTGKTLAEYLTSEFVREYTIVVTGIHNNVQALVRSPDTSEPVPVLEAQEPISEPKVTQEAAPRYNYRFWAAFSVPLAKGRRFLDLRDFRFVDADEEPVGNYIEVESEYIAKQDTQDRNSFIRQNIKRWLEAKKLPEDQFVVRIPHMALRPPHLAGNRSILEAVIDSLDRRQLASTNMSLEVVAELLRRRV